MKKRFLIFLSVIPCLFVLCSCTEKESNAQVQVIDIYEEPSLKPVVVSTKDSKVLFKVEYSGNTSYIISCTASILFDTEVEKQLVIINLNETYEISNLKHKGTYTIKLKYSYYTDETRKSSDIVTHQTTFQI